MIATSVTTALFCPSSIATISSYLDINQSIFFCFILLSTIDPTTSLPHPLVYSLRVLNLVWNLPGIVDSFLVFISVASICSFGQLIIPTGFWVLVRNFKKIPGYLHNKQTSNTLAADLKVVSVGALLFSIGSEFQRVRMATCIARKTCSFHTANFRTYDSMFFGHIWQICPNMSRTHTNMSKEHILWTYLANMSKEHFHFNSISAMFQAGHLLCNVPSRSSPPIFIQLHVGTLYVTRVADLQWMLASWFPQLNGVLLIFYGSMHSSFYVLYETWTYILGQLLCLSVCCTEADYCLLNGNGILCESFAINNSITFFCDYNSCWTLHGGGASSELVHEKSKHNSWGVVSKIG